MGVVLLPPHGSRQVSEVTVIPRRTVPDHQVLIDYQCRHPDVPAEQAEARAWR